MATAIVRVRDFRVSVPLAAVLHQQTQSVGILRRAVLLQFIQIMAIHSKNMVKTHKIFLCHFSGSQSLHTVAALQSRLLRASIRWVTDMVGMRSGGVDVYEMFQSGRLDMMSENC